MGIKNDRRKNAEGYSDPTAYEALRNIEQEEDRFHKLLDTILRCVSCPISTLKNGLLLRINEPDGFGGDYLCLTKFEKHYVQGVFIERFALIRMHISGIWKPW